MCSSWTRRLLAKTGYESNRISETLCQDFWQWSESKFYHVCPAQPVEHQDRVHRICFTAGEIVDGPTEVRVLVKTSHGLLL